MGMIPWDPAYTHCSDRSSSRVHRSAGGIRDPQARWSGPRRGAQFNLVDMWNHVTRTLLTYAGLQIKNRLGDAEMEPYQWFLLGVMTAWMPSLIVLAILTNLGGRPEDLRQRRN